MHKQLQPWTRTGVALAILGSLLQVSQARCLDDVVQEGKGRSKAAVAPSAQPKDTTAWPDDNPRDPTLQLQAMAREAVRRSAELGANQLLMQAAAADLDDTKGNGLPQVGLNALLATASSSTDNVVTSKGKLMQGGINASWTLYDGGRLNQLTQWRTQLMESAKQGAAVTQEQVVLTTVLTALDRNRYRLQAQVYQQQARKMSCLVDALDEIARDLEVHVRVQQREPHVAQRVADVGLGNLPEAAQVAENILELARQRIKHGADCGKRPRNCQPFAPPQRFSCGEGAGLNYVGLPTARHLFSTINGRSAGMKLRK